MGDQTQQMVTQKWYAKPQVLIPVAGVGYLFINKKTRRTALLGAGAFLVYNGLKMRSSGDGLNQSFAGPTLALGGALIFFGLRKKK